MNEIVLYSPEQDRIQLWIVGELPKQWRGEPYSVWNTLEIAIEYGWEVIGEL